jgi:hypothetical protein
MRIAAVDARAETEAARRVLALAISQAPVRLLLFGATGPLAAAQVAREQTRRDERYLDVAARWLLDGGSGAPPTRAGLAVPLLEIGVAVRGDEASAPIPTTTRAIELVGSQLCMAVAERSGIHADEWENAALWIAGGEGEPGVHVDRARPAIVPGDADSGGGLALIDVGGAEARVTLLDRDGRVIATRTLPLGAGPRMSVQAVGAERR